MRTFVIIGVVLYAICMVGLVTGMLRLRSSASAVFATEAAQADWETWREDVRAQAPTEGPTKRDVPKSPEPPALVLMRDNFAACTIFALVMSSALYLTVAVVVYGAMQKTTIRDD